jgi:hypothetical protein
LNIVAFFVANRYANILRGNIVVVRRMVICPGWSVATAINPHHQCFVDYRLKKVVFYIGYVAYYIAYIKYDLFFAVSGQCIGGVRLLFSDDTYLQVT